MGIENGMDTFDCVAPTRIARHGTIYTKFGKIHITNEKFQTDFGQLDDGCECYTCKHHTRAYVAHLFRVHEITAATLASIHNVYFLVNLVKKAREAILNDTWEEFKEDFIKTYK
jgi:queuine tRNA-ribosyltransferase